MVNPPEPSQRPAARISRLSWKTVLRDLDLCIHRGERVAIIGASGSGKSKLLECILGLRRPDAGAIELLGHAVTGRPLALEGLGVAFQEPGLFDDWTIRENLTLVWDRGEVPPSKQGFSADAGPGPGATVTADQADVESLLAEVGLANVLALDATPARLSGGQKKRLALLRALLRGTELLVLDEPTSGLDPQDSSGVCEFLARRLEEGNRALLLVTHDYSLAARLCNRIFSLQRGALVEVPPDEILERAEEVRSTPAPSGPLGPSFAQPSRGASAGLRRIQSHASFLGGGLIVALPTMALLGFVLVVQSAGTSYIDVSPYVPRAIVTAVFRELAPLVVGLLLAARIGARMSSRTAAMSYTAQLDSMRLLGMSPARRILGPFVLTSVFAFPLAILGGAAIAVGAGWLSVAIGCSGLTIGAERFGYLAREALTSRLWLSAAVKAVLMGVLVSVGAYAIGSRRVESAAMLGERVTIATTVGSLCVVGADLLLSVVFFG